jgi:putative transcriptional regulator
MSNEFHVAEEDLFEYGAGALEEAWSLAIAAHLSFCTSCRSATEQFEALGGIALEDLSPSELDANSLALCLKTLDEQAPEGNEFSVSEGSILPGVLQKYVGSDLDQIQWKRVGGGVKQAIIPTKGNATARLLRIPPGVAVPEHSHNGTELTVVLAGSYVDGPHLFERGDIQQADTEVHHSPSVVGAEECVCLVATDAPLKFKSIVPRVVQKFISL